MANIRWLDVIIILLYMVAVAYIGWRCSHRQTTTESYFVAKRAIPHWVMGFSFFATLISSITFIAYPGSAYASNWNELNRVAFRKQIPISDFPDQVQTGLDEHQPVSLAEQLRAVQGQGWRRVADCEEDG